MTFRQHKVVALGPVRIGGVDFHHRAVQYRQRLHNRHTAAVVAETEIRQRFKGGDANIPRQLGHFFHIHDLAPLFSCAPPPADLFFAKTLYTTSSTNNATTSPVMANGDK